MGDIYRNINSSVAGLKPVFWFVPVGDVLSVTNGIVVLKSGKQWFTARSTKFKNVFTSQQKEGDIHGVELKALITKDSPDLEYVLSKLSTLMGYLVVYCDNNGYYWLVGTLKTPLKFLSAYSSGNAPGNSVGITYSFSGNVLSFPKQQFNDSITAVPVPITD